MIDINYKEKLYKFRNLFSEITIQEYEDITTLFNKEGLNNITIWLGVFEILKWDEDVVDNLDINSFEEIIKEFNFNDINKEIIKTVVIDGVNYSCYNDQFKLKIKDLLKIEEVLREGDYLSKIPAILYNREGFSKAENEDQKHFEYKVNMFKNESANIVTPLLEVINKSLLKKNSIDEQ